MLSIEGVKVGVKNPHSLLELGNVINNVTDFINEVGKVVVCETCLEIAGFDKKMICLSLIFLDHMITELLHLRRVVYLLCMLAES
jgi:hypothetical protein